MLSARWLRCVAVLVAVVVLAAGCGGEPEPAAPEPAAEAEAEAPTGPEPGSDGAAVPAVVSDAVADLAAAWGDVDPSVPPLGDFDPARVLAAAETLDPDAVCPAVVGPESLEDVVEVLRVEGGCALVEYVALAGRSVPEVREEIFASDPTALAVGIPPRDLVPTAEYDPADYGLAPPRGYAGDEYEAGDWWYLDAVGAAKLWQSDGWEYPTSSGSTNRVQAWSEEVTIAVLDTGTADHRDLADSFADTSGDAWLSLACHHDSPDSHGTHVAGLIAARPNNAMDSAGIAPQAKILPIHLLNDYDPSAPCPANAADLDTAEGETTPRLTATQAVRLAAEAGADIVNMSFSWGHVGSPAALKSDGSDAFAATIMLMRQRHGTVFVAAAGNCGDPNNLKDCPDGLNTESYPAAYRLVYGVGAVNRANDRAVFSTVNSHVDFALPGDGASNYSGLLSTVPLVSCNPTDTDNDGTTDQWAPRGCGDSANPQACGADTPRRRSSFDTPATCAHRVAHFAGTSMAAPLMSGVFAHILARYPDAPAEQVFEALLATMVNPDTGTTHARTDEYGYGVVDPVAALEYLNALVAEPGDQPTTIPDIGVEPAVSIAAGADARGAPGPDGTPCTGEHCRYVEITLTDAPEGDYTVECYSSANPDQPWHTATWHWPNNTQWTQGGCAYDTPGDQVWATVTNPYGSLTTNPITWPTTTPPTTQPPDTAPPPEPPPPTPTTGTFSAISAGGLHSCGLRSDGTITCWGNNEWGQAEAPGGVFSAISTGGWHSCGLRSDGTIACWGNSAGQAEAPGGVFSAISAGGLHSCGLRSDGTITCWGYNQGRAEVPGGSFSAVSAGSAHGREHSCGLRSDGTITCWGDNEWGQAEAPGGVFSAISAGSRHSCGLRSDGTVTCWGDNDWGQAEAPGGVFSAVSAGGEDSCGLRSDGTITCWGRSQGLAEAPGGVFSAVSAGESNSCGLRSDGTITCWGQNALDLRGGGGEEESVAPAVSERSVVLSRGRNAQGVDPDCSIANCHFLRVELVGFDLSAGPYEVRCWHYAVPSAGWEHAEWENYTTAQVASEYCIWGVADHDVYVIVEDPRSGETVRSNDARWP